MKTLVDTAPGGLGTLLFECNGHLMEADASDHAGGCTICQDATIKRRIKLKFYSTGWLPDGYEIQIDAAYGGCLCNSGASLTVCAWSKNFIYDGTNYTGGVSINNNDIYTPANHLDIRGSLIQSGFWSKLFRLSVAIADIPIDCSALTVPCDTVYPGSDCSDGHYLTIAWV